MQTDYSLKPAEACAGMIGTDAPATKLSMIGEGTDLDHGHDCCARVKQFTSEVTTSCG